MENKPNKETHEGTSNSAFFICLKEVVEKCLSNRLEVRYMHLIFMKARLFTLIELIVVIVVLGILAAIVIPNISSIKEDAERTSIISNARNLQTSVDMFILEHNGATPTKENPSIGNPQTLEVYGLHPEHTRQLPKNKGIHWWLDYNHTVWASYVDAPKDVSFESNVLKWKTVDGAELYRIYSSNENKITTTSSTKGISNVRDFRPSENSVEFQSLEGLEELTSGTYLVSAIDKFGFETPPTKADTTYLGYIEPDKDFMSSLDVVPQPDSTQTIPPLHSLYFDGNDYVVAKKSHLLNIGNNFTLEAKITPASLVPTNGSISQSVNILGTWGSTGVGNASYYLGINQGKFRVGFFNGSVGEGYSSIQTLEVDKTYFVSAVLEGNELKIYIDNKLDSTHIVNVLPQYTNYPVTIGMEANYGYNYYTGSIHDIRIWNRPLTSNEVQKPSLSNNEPNLILHYDFENILSNTVLDKTNNKLDGIIYGAIYLD